MIAGHHTISELKELLAAKDYDIRQVQTAFDAFAPDWQKQDSAGFGRWVKDWNVFSDRYNAAHERADDAIRLALLITTPNALIPAEDRWQDILHALTPVDGVMTPDSFQGLYTRFTDASKQAVDFSGQPQPSATDVDLAAFQATDSTLRALPDIPGINAPPIGTGTKILLGCGVGFLLVLALRR